VLLRIAERARFFPGNDDRFYARFAVDGHEETHELRSSSFIFRALIDAIAGGMRMEPLLDLSRLPRIADFAHFAEAVCQGLGHPPGAFLAAYDRNRQAANESVLDDSPVARTIRAFVADANSWTGTASELLDELSAMAGERDLASKAWPRRPKVLSSILRRIAPQLRTTGVVVDFDRSTNSRTITLGRKDRAADDPSLTARAS
jgi:putative DNA primase/helicase